MEKTKKKTEEKVEKAGIVRARCIDQDCHIHGKLKTRGKIFEGVVISKSHKRIAIGLEKTIYVKKYERYAKSRTKIHARLPICMEEEINVGNLVKIRECRPLSKIIHFVVLGKVEKKKGGSKK